jgi:RimJ/RimL family protein N-acetyltransferase
MISSPYEGRLIRLRAREPEDEPFFHRWINDPDVTEYLSARYPLSHAFERKWVQDNDTPSFGNAGFAVETLAESKLIGTVGLHEVSAENRTAILGIAIGDKTRWDGGYGTDTMRTICRFGFQMMNLHRIELDVYAENLRARRVYEKVGFKLEGCRRQAIYKFGRYFDVMVMGLLEGELILD